MTLTTPGDGSCNAARSTATSPQTITVRAGPVPIVLVPRVTTRVALAGYYGPGIVATMLETITGTLRLSYDRKTWRRSSRLARSTSHRLDDSGSAPTASQTLSTTITPTASILLDGLAGPHLDLADRPSLTFAPPASLDLAHATSATDGLEPTAKPLTDGRAPGEATILNASEPLDHRTLAGQPGATGGDDTSSSTQVVTGNGITYALRQSGRLYCWVAGPSATAAPGRPCRCSWPARATSVRSPPAAPTPAPCSPAAASTAGATTAMANSATASSRALRSSRHTHRGLTATVEGTTIAEVIDRPRRRSACQLGRANSASHPSVRRDHRYRPHRHLPSATVGTSDSKWPAARVEPRAPFYAVRRGGPASFTTSVAPTPTGTRHLSRKVSARRSSPRSRSALRTLACR